eukprot:7452030-Pyramimonas_sp.AAC.1
MSTVGLHSSYAQKREDDEAEDAREGRGENGKAKAISKKLEQLQERRTIGKAGTAQELRHQELQQQELIQQEHSSASSRTG